jgi:hypothetical protein
MKRVNTNTEWKVIVAPTDDIDSAIVQQNGTQVMYRKHVRRRECGPFNVALDYVSFGDETEGWEVVIELTDGRSTHMNFATLDEAAVVYYRWVL